jgi:hypothetical protein
LPADRKAGVFWGLAMGITGRIRELKYDLTKHTNIYDLTIVVGYKEYAELIKYFHNQFPNHLYPERSHRPPDEFEGNQIILIPVDSFLEVGTSKGFDLFLIKGER